MLDTPFDTDTEEGTPERQLLPAGRYKAEITKATYGPTKNGKGHKIDLTAVIVGGEHDKRVQFASILMQHESEDAQRFGRQKFKDLCVACGVGGQVTDLDALLYKPIMINVSIRKDKNGEYYVPKNWAVKFGLGFMQQGLFKDKEVANSIAKWGDPEVLREQDAYTADRSYRLTPWFADWEAETWGELQKAILGQKDPHQVLVELADKAKELKKKYQ